MSINPFQQTKNVRLYYDTFSPTFIEIPISNNATETVWVSDGVTMKYLRNRIDEISGGYFGDLPTTTTTTAAAAAATSTTALHNIENKCYDYPSANVLTGFVIGIALIILLLSINLIVMISTKRSKYRTKMENISGEPLRFHEIFSDLNHPRQQQQ
jgi:multisubunit Na+/H+ antiporter MnhC subunit